MEKIIQKLTVFNDALKTLRDGFDWLREKEGEVERGSLQKSSMEFLTARDSLIQRFEYCTDLFWKLLKVYLEEVEKVDVAVNSPRGIIRDAVRVKLMDEQEGEACIEMVTSRNQTTHIYHEEIAEDIAAKVPGYYELMKEIADRVQSKVR